MGQALRRASGSLRAAPPPPPPARPPPSHPHPPPPRATPAAAAGGGGGSPPQDRLDASQDDVTPSTKDGHGVLVERDPSYDDMLKHMVGRITTKPGGKPEMGEASVVERYNCWRCLLAALLLLPWNSPSLMVSLTQEHTPSIQEPLHFESEEPKVVVAENDKMVEIQDKEVTLEGLCSVTAYDQWTPLSVSGQPPKPRYKHGAAVVQEKMYVFGGNHNGRYLGDIQVLDLKSLSWSKLEPKIQSESSESAEPVLVAPCAGHSLITSGNKILSLAGHTREHTESLSVQEFDPQTCTWSILRTYGKSPSSCGGQSVTRVGDTLVVFGGEGEGRSLLNDLHVLDLETMTWDEFESTGTPPSPRSEHAAACYADRYLLIFGGGSHSTCFSDLYLLDMQTMEWSRPGQHDITPEARAGHAGVTVGDNWFITGGGNSKKGVPETLVLNMSTLVWSVVTSFEGRAPPTSEGSSLVLHTINGEDFMLSFGGYSGRYSNEVYALKTSLRPSVSSSRTDELETNGMTPLSAEANSSRGPIFEIEELRDDKNSKGGDISKTLVQAVKHEKNQVEERLEQEKLQSFHLKKELADVENKNVELTKELQSVRDQLSDEAARASKLENEVSEIQQRLQKMETLEKEFELLRSERGGERPGSVGFRRWYGDDER